MPKYYIQFGSDSKLQLEYSWDVLEELKTEPIDNELSVLPQTQLESQITDQPEIKPNNEPSAILKQLLSLAKLHYRKERIRCPCGHVCGGPPRTSSASRGKSFTAKNNARNIEEVCSVRFYIYCILKLTFSATQFTGRKSHYIRIALSGQLYAKCDRKGRAFIPNTRHLSRTWL